MKILTLLLISGLSGQMFARDHRSNTLDLTHPALRQSAGPVIQAEVKANSISIFRIKSDSVTIEQRAVFPKGSYLSVTAGDQNTGSPEIYLKFNEAQEKLYREPIKLIAKGRHTLKIRAINSIGLESSLTLTYLIIE